MLEKYFPHTPTASQSIAFAEFERFMNESSGQRKPTFILTGYAGTGKTSALIAMQKAMRYMGKKTLMLAPTGRAAKVMSAYTGRQAFTIHRIIFQYVERNGKMTFGLRENKAKNTVYFIDEASMLPDGYTKGQGLLEQVLRFAHGAPDSSNIVVMIGDTAQLPPIGSSDSPALNAEYVARNYKAYVKHASLTDVMRQGLESGILKNATLLREQFHQGASQIKIISSAYKDIFKMTGERLEDGLRYAYDKHGMENTVVITRSNKAATMYNQYIRRQIKFSESEIDAGDMLMVVKNNYHWLDNTSEAGFLANGDFAEVERIESFEEMHGMRFANLTLRLLDQPKQPPFEAKIHLGTLHSFTSSLTEEETNALYASVEEDYMDIESLSEKKARMAKDEYLNALQVKFAHALTCHKAQGGQWDAVFIDQGFLREDMINIEFVRWLYTAITRGKSEVFLVNFMPRFFE